MHASVAFAGGVAFAGLFGLLGVDPLTLLVIGTVTMVLRNGRRMVETRESV